MTEILYAEDDEAVREMVSTALEAAGYHVRTASNGAEALDEARRKAPDLVLLDYKMGVPDGIEVCRRIKADPRLAHLPVLILTGQSAIEDRLHGFDAGADDYLAKPFDPRELLARVRALLRLSVRTLDRNPTSGLPGGSRIQGEIERLQASGEEFAVCYFDLDYFKPLGDRFGFAVADSIIRAVGVVLAEVGAERGIFAGHVGGDDFVLLASESEARAAADDVRERFAMRATELLPPEVVRDGEYTGRDREGHERRFPLTRLSVAIVQVPPEATVSLAALGELVAATKQRAKWGDGVAEARLTS